MGYSLIALALGFALDMIIGDPENLWHPIRGIGKLILWTEKAVRRIFPKTPKGERIGGMVLVLVVGGISAFIPVILLCLLYQWNPLAGVAAESIMCYQLLATKALKAESMKVYKALKGNSLEEGRKMVARIVGRDTEALSEEGVIKATVETIGENTSDGSIAPMFFMAIGGAGLGFFYKAVNTMDSMIGYKNEKYLYFGRTAARLDDILNYIPARLSALLMILAAVFTPYSTRNAWKIYKRDRYNHASPNSAHTEAVTAGALEIQLAGDAYYFGTLYPKKTIGDPVREVTTEDIKKANRLLYITVFLGMIVLGSLKFFLIYLIDI